MQNLPRKTNKTFFLSPPHEQITAKGQQETPKVNPPQKHLREPQAKQKNNLMREPSKKISLPRPNNTPMKAKQKVA
jgi:hypothetical protein